MKGIKKPEFGWNVATMPRDDYRSYYRWSGYAVVRCPMCDEHPFGDSLHLIPHNQGELWDGGEFHCPVCRREGYFELAGENEAGEEVGDSAQALFSLSPELPFGVARRLHALLPRALSIENALLPRSRAVH